MAKATLVGPDVELGEKILAALDAAKFPAAVVLWLLRTEDDPWELVVSTPRSNERDIYLQFVQAIGPQIPVTDFPIHIESNRHPLVKALKLMRKVGLEIEGRRMGPQTLGDEWVQDAYVYRIR